MDRRRACYAEVGLAKDSPRHCLTPVSKDSRVRWSLWLLSIVIPTLNEEAGLQRLLPNLQRDGAGEIIVVDGGSEDATVEIAESFDVRILKSSPGRGIQQAVGARAAAGDSILFLHADTSMPLGFEGEIARILKQPGVVAGAFRLKIDAPQPSVRFIESMANLRSRCLRSPYGDQGIFVRKNVLESIGGVPEIPLLEDVRMIRSLRRLGQIVISPLSATTSGRCWTGHGTLRTTAANMSTCAGYILGVDPVRLAAWRRRILPPVSMGPSS
ncbi:MAG: rSAM/selenodomain-associated transferase 2 [Planctomycetota bacterium]|jgi:rSAM/selenodomain-associated transferase 2